MTATVKFVITGYSEILLNKKHLQLTANALLRGEQRNTNAAAYHLKH